MGKIKNQNAFSLIEVIVSLFVIMVLTLGVYSLIVMLSQTMNLNKMYVIAIELANQKMEQIRNLPYDDVGVATGTPSGVLDQVEYVEREGEFKVNTYITYHDDPADGLLGSSTNPDAILNDYKIATVVVSWVSKFGPRDVTVFSKIIPRTVETDQGFGLLKLTVRDSYAQPVANASIRVVNNATVPPIDVINLTNPQGVLYLPATSSNESYEISVSKAFEVPNIYYGQDQTYATSSGKNPRHLSVSMGNMTEEEFQVDKLATLRLRTVTSNLPDNYQVNALKVDRNEHSPSIAADSNSNLFFVWQADNATSTNVYLAKTDLSGNRLWASDKRLGNSVSESNPDIAVGSAGDMFVVWQDKSVGLKKITKAESANRYAKLDSNTLRNPKIIQEPPKISIKERIAGFFIKVGRGIKNVIKKGMEEIAVVFEKNKEISKKLIKNGVASLNTKEAKALGTIVQSIKVSATVVSNNSVSLSFNNPPTAGNMMIVVAIHENSNQSFTSVTNTSGAFTTSVISNVSFGLDVGVWHKVAGVGEPSTVTVNASDDFEGGLMMLMEVSGIDPANPIDVIKTNDQTSNSSKVGTTGLSPVSTDNGFALAAIAFADNDFNNPTSANWSSGSSGVWTQRQWTEINGDDDSSIGVATMDVTSAAAQQATLTVTGGWSNEERNSVLVVYNLFNPDDVVVAGGGIQEASVLRGNLNTYLGGYFSIIDMTGSHNITSIKINESGTIDAQNNLDNIKLYYDLDTTAPYDCSSESFGGTEMQYGVTDSDGFSGSNGFVQMNGNVSIGPAQSMCIYLVADIGIASAKDETIELEILSPATDITLNSGTVIPATIVLINDTTQIDIPAESRQTAFRWRQDDGDESGASWLEDTNIAIMARNNGILRLRFRVENVGSLLDSTMYRLEYGEKITSCSAILASEWEAIPNNDTLDWRTSASLNFNDGEVTSEQIGAGAFVTGEIKEDANQTSSITLGEDEASELEFTLSPTTNAEDSTYCFRLSDAGTALDVYNIYAEANIVGDDNVYIIRLDTNGNEVWSAKRVNSDDSNSDQINPEIAMTENFGIATTVVVWQDNRSGNFDIYAQAFDSGGLALWNGGNDLLISASGSDEVYPTLTILSDDRVVIAWTELGTLNSVYYTKYDLNGIPVQASPMLGPTSIFPTSEVSLTADAFANFYLSYTENVSGNTTVFAAKYDSTGTKLWDKALNKDSALSNRFNSAISVSNTNLYAVWTDFRNANMDVYGQKLDLDGNYVWTRDLLLNITTSSSTQESPALVSAFGDRPFCAWSDERAPLSAIFSAELIEPGVISSVPNVALHLWGTNTISETPKIYEYDLYPVTDGSGEALVYVEPDPSGYMVEATSTYGVILLEPTAPLPLIPAQDQVWNIYVQ